MAASGDKFMEEFFEQVRLYATLAFGFWHRIIARTVIISHISNTHEFETGKFAVKTKMCTNVLCTLGGHVVHTDVDAMDF